MPLPLLAIDFATLQGKLSSSGTQEGEISRVKVYEFIDIDGEKRQGFYKPLNLEPPGYLLLKANKYYPAFLAEYAVAASVAMRLALNDRVAEERLVFKGNELVGTISIAIPGFKPLYNYGQTAPTDLELNEEVNPSVASLIFYNYAELLVSLELWDEDDGHPDNVGREGIIDRDMTLYKITRIIKWSREVKKRFTKETIDNFPNDTEATYNPAKTPPNINIPNTVTTNRFYLSFAQFQELATNPAERMNKNGEEVDVCFQEQMFTALLKELLAFDPKVIRARLEQYFGDLPFDISALPEYIRVKLIEEYPQYFQNEDITFVDHIMRVFESEHQYLYDLIVGYEGCAKNKSGASVASFNTFLNQTPTAGKRIIANLMAENERMAKAYERYKTHENDSENVNTNIPTAYCMPLTARPDGERLKQKYHQIWRDSFRKALENKLAIFDKLVGALPMPPKKNDGFLGKSYSMFANVISSPSVYLTDVEPIGKDLREHFKNYFDKKKELEPLDNATFIQGINATIGAFNSLIKDTNLANDMAFGKAIKDLEELANHINLKAHLDNDIDVILPHSTITTTIRNNIQLLFNWLEKKDNQWFCAEILKETQAKYIPKSHEFYAVRSRVAEVQFYSQLKDKSVNLFAQLIHRGGCASTSLNTILLKHFFTEMLKEFDCEDPANIELKKLSLALNTNQWDFKSYVNRAQFYVQKVARFDCVERIRQINELCFAFVEKINEQTFHQILMGLLADYTPSALNFITNKTRHKEIPVYMEKPSISNTELLAHIFKEGGCESNSFNTLLFQRIVKEIKAMPNTNVEQGFSDEEIKLLSYLQDTPQFILESLADYAREKLTTQVLVTEPSHDQALESLADHAKAPVSVTEPGHATS